MIVLVGFDEVLELSTQKPQDILLFVNWWNVIQARHDTPAALLELAHFACVPKHGRNQEAKPVLMFASQLVGVMNERGKHEVIAMSEEITGPLDASKVWSPQVAPCFVVAMKHTCHWNRIGD